MTLKVCSCGLRHDAHSWRCLQFVGFMEDGEGGWLMLRNCQCGTTLAVPYDR